MNFGLLESCNYSLSHENQIQSIHQDRFIVDSLSTLSTILIIKLQIKHLSRETWLKLTLVWERSWPKFDCF